MGIYGKNMDLKKHEIRMGGREGAKDKAGRELWHVNVVSEIWALTVIGSSEYYHSQRAVPCSF